ncbi:NADH-dependent phenylglyoxylate dehydrogenase subunit epsilon [bacterium BMS3Bbin10]|nr:NADH-dependent phenylglyoxylate dehydrogenase subunit epsilon [bacterium BMS3Bbin10]HDL16775.1 NAD(P)/FAD-dependent oxidoreductase [Hyphomicrobiales bacterium]
MHHVILGAGPAGVIAADTLRKHDAGAKITLMSAEDEPPYSRMAIPYFLSSQIDEEGTYLRQDHGHYKNQGIELLRARAGAVDANNQTIALEDGGEVQYDRLLIATGASPVHPRVEGLDLPGVHTCWTLEDARAILDRAHKGDDVVLMGAGFIGSIILEALVSRDVKLNVVEMGDRMVARMMDETAGGMLKRWCEEHGVAVLTGTRITQITRSKDRLDVALSSGKSLRAKLVVVAAGIAPNIGFLEGSGIKTRQGVKVDGFMRTSAPHVYAAGDVAQAKDLSTGEFSVLAIQPVAADHGRIAALNMAGHATPHAGSLNMNVLATIGLVSSSFGAWDGVEGGMSAATSDADAYRYLRLEFDGDRLAGAQGVGLTDHIGVARGLIGTRLRLGRWKDVLMKSPERLAEAYVACAQGIR